MSSWKWLPVLALFAMCRPAQTHAQTFTADEEQAVRWARDLVEGEETFFQREDAYVPPAIGRYAASIDELRSAAVLDPTLGKDNEAHGYIFEVHGSAKTFQVIASPRSPKSGRSFFVDETGMVRSVSTGKPAATSPVDGAATRRFNQSYAVAVLTQIFTAEALYREHDGQSAYAPTLAALEKYLGRGWTTGTIHGYRYSLEVKGASFTCVAVPTTPGDTGNLGFWVGQDCVIRFSDDGSAPGPNSPILDDLLRPQ